MANKELKSLTFDDSDDVYEIYDEVARTGLESKLDSTNIGQFVSLGFDGTLASNVLTFTPPTGSSAYTLTENHLYELDLHFAVSGTVDDTVQVEVDNDGEDMPIQFYAVTHNDVTTPITWAEFKKMATYDDTNGYRWLVIAGYHITSSGIPCFVVYPTINNSLTSVQLYSDGTSIYDKQDGTVLTYAQIYELISNKYNLVSVNYENVVILYPVFWDGSAISFSNTYIYDSKCWQQRVIINSDNQVLFNEYQVVTPTELTPYAKTADLLEKSTEVFTFTLEDGTEVQRTIVLGA